jgi:hypothetical protein
LLFFDLGVGLRCNLDEVGNLGVVETGQATEVTGEMNGMLIALAAKPTKAEQLVDGTLKLERIL